MGNYENVMFCAIHSIYLLLRKDFIEVNIKTQFVDCSILWLGGKFHDALWCEFEKKNIVVRMVEKICFAHFSLCFSATLFHSSYAFDYILLLCWKYPR